MVTKALLEDTISSHGKSLSSHSHEAPVLLVFLRQLGCVFCKQSMKELAKRQAHMAENGVSIVLVHMADTQTAEPIFEEYDLHHHPHIEDPSCSLYKSFGLVKGTVSQLFGFKTWATMGKILVEDPSMMTKAVIGDGKQMPGIFVLRNNEIVDQFIHETAADFPDYDRLVQVCVTKR